MWELIHKRHNANSAAQLLAQMREELVIISEKERVLRERSADREVYRYLLDARRLITRASSLGERVLSISPPGAGEGGQLAALLGSHCHLETKRGPVM